ncbi:hypothetical protein LTR36_004015 [Oleoguttula mirabilis]|uniref:Heterokaryon incompatibility domain-containing protein n=1 Tax=Oleoguttula mirabilis TaxID=1507867 RepID=A0AAV9JHP8_9PEZI|nr:hypothetical protein LTR36_004015 [Oleoguttula mirabilis]
MRLLNTQTYELQEFFEGQIPEYVILSHRWTHDEVTYKEFRKGQNKDGAGYRKIMQCCAFARSMVREFVWIDTCCIDKRSSAELSEAINSMWRYYANARECYAYLADVPSLDHGRDAVLRRLRSSDWFNRGWTLQELLAPPAFVFCNRAWEIIGSRDALCAEVSAITGIAEQYLRRFRMSSGEVTTVSVAERMSWASKRQCTRSEDQAYCLLGLFGVNMPLLYGEGGENAFRRLQLETISTSDDESIFAWCGSPSMRSSASSMFASSPSAFAEATNIHQITPNYTGSLYDHEFRLPYAMTNKGLSLQGQAVRVTKNRHTTATVGLYMIFLNCFDATDRRWPVLLQALPGHVQSFKRVHTELSPHQINNMYPRSKREVVGMMQFYVR